MRVSHKLAVVVRSQFCFRHVLAKHCLAASCAVIRRVKVAPTLEITTCGFVCILFYGTASRVFHFRFLIVDTNPHVLYLSDDHHIYPYIAV